MIPRIVIIGAGGHAKVVCDAILANGEYKIAGFVDAEIPVGTVIFDGHKVIASQKDIPELNKFADHFIIAIGNNQIREKLFIETVQYLKPAIVVHPSCVIAKNITLSDGTVCLANSVINADCTIGKNVIINSCVVVDHDSIIGNNVHLSIGTMVGSNSSIADYTTTSIGQKINSFSK